MGYGVAFDHPLKNAKKHPGTKWVGTPGTNQVGRLLSKSYQQSRWYETGMGGALPGSYHFFQGFAKEF